MINTRKELRKVIDCEKEIYLDKSTKIEKIITSDVSFYIFKFIKLLRLTEYHHNKQGLIHKLCYIFYRRIKNRLGIKLGIEIWDNTFESGLTIYHAGNIVVNGMSKIGKNCKLHGSNCIGNDGKTLKSPVMGDNVRLGVGAKVIGDVYIANNVTIAAGAVVIHSCDEEGAVLAGVPARIVRYKNEN
jgi:serine O-acetyltransferase